MNTRIRIPYRLKLGSKGMLALKIASGILLLLLLVGGILWQVKSPLLPQWICSNCGSSTLTYPTIYMARHTDISKSGLNPPPIQTFLYAINGQSGKVQQTINLQSTSNIYYQKISNGVNYELFSNQSNSILLATTLRDGTTRWRGTFSPQFISVVADSSILYLYGSSGVIAINLQNGAQLWKDDIGNINDIRLADTTLIVQEGNKDDIVALSAKNGQELWRHTNLTNDRVLTPIIEDGHAFFGYHRYPSGTQQGQLSLLELDEHSGNLLWQNKIELGKADASFYIRDHCILIETTDKKLTVLRETDKSVLWSYTLPSSYNLTQHNLWFYSDNVAYGLSTEIDPRTFAARRTMTAWQIDNGKKLFQTTIDINRDFSIYYLNDQLLFTSNYSPYMGQPDSNTQPLSNDIEARQAQTGKLLWHKHLGQLPVYKGGTAWKLSLVETSDTHSDDCSGVVCPYSQDLQNGDDLGYRPATDLHSNDQGFTTFYTPGSGEQKQLAMYITLYEEASKSYMLYAVDPQNGATLWQLMPDTLSAITLPMVTEFSLPTAANVPESITAGPDGNLWFTETTSTTSIQQHEPQIGKIGRATPAGKISEFSLPEGTLPEEITAGADGNLWFTENQDDQAGKIGRITPAGKISEFVLPPFQGGNGVNKSSRPHGIAAGRDGNIWFIEVFGENIGRITPTGKITEFPLPTGVGQPGAITAGPDGNLWFVSSGLGATSDTIGRITPSGELTLFPDPGFSGDPFAITAGPDHNLWFVELAANQITRATPLGMMNEFILPTSGSMPLSITGGTDGNLWFTSSPKNQIGRITPTGQITEFTLPTFGSQSNDITSGPDGNLWFTEVGGDQAGKIGRIVTASIIGTSANQSQVAKQNATATADAQHRADQQNAHATATPNAIQSTQTINGTWQEQDNEGVSRWNITQSQSSIAGDGTTFQGVHVTISGSVNNQSVTIVERATGNNCSDTYTFTINQNNTEMDGSMYSGCNGQSYKGIVFQKQ